MTDQPRNPIFVRPIAGASSTAPFEGDLFDRKKQADRLTKMLDHLPDGCVFAIDAPWGEGKSWFAQHWSASLGEQGYRCAYVDAFQHDYLDDPFLMISGAVLGLVKENESELRHRMLDATKKLGRAVLPAAVKVALGIAGRLALGNVDLADEVKKGLESVEENAAAVLEKQIERRLADYEAHKQTVEAFKVALSELAAQTQKPVVILIDELDRCRPDFAVMTVERIKHFFEVPKVVFVLFMNKRQLVEAVRGTYGAGLDAETYLGKFVQFTLSLPKRVSIDFPSRDHSHIFLEHTLTRYGFKMTDPVQNFVAGFVPLANLLRLSLRDIERATILFSYAQPLKDRAWQSSWPIALKLARPKIFQGLTENLTEAHQEAKNLAESLKLRSPGVQLLDFVAAYHDTCLGAEPKPEVAREIGRYAVGNDPGEYMIMLCRKVDLALSD